VSICEFREAAKYVCTSAYVDPAWNKDHTLREGYAMVNTMAESNTEGMYYLRYLEGAKRFWRSVG
jgi:hypothetical protein